VDAAADKPAKEYDEEEGKDDPFDDDAFLFSWLAWQSSFSFSA
jgi:hypothetical protein